MESATKQIMGFNERKEPRDLEAREDTRLLANHSIWVMRVGQLASIFDSLTKKRQWLHAFVASHPANE